MTDRRAVTATPPRRLLTPAQRASMIAEIRGLDQLERRGARGRLEPFLYRYLGEDFYNAPGEFHRGIYADVEAMVYQRPIDGEVRDSAAYAYPRGHGKTTTLTKGTLLWIIHEWRTMAHFRGKPPFILIVSDTMDQARDRSLDLRDELEGNELLREDYGDKVPGRKRKSGQQRWTETDWTTTDGVRIKAVGAGGKVRGLLRKGRRPTLIVGDDLENDEAVGTKARRLKLERWMQKALIPTGLEGHLLTIIVGTILHADSLLSRLLSPDRYEGWLKRRFAAQYNDEGLPSSSGKHALWPQGWPIADLISRRRKIGSIAFAQEYLNQAVDEETALFLMDWLRAAKNRGRGIGFLYGPPDRIPFSLVVSTWDYVELATKSAAGAYQVVVTGWDVAVIDDERKARERDSSYTVGVTIGLTAADRLEVRRIFRKRGMSPAELRNRVIAEQNVVQADYVAIENNQAQKIHEIELRGIPNMPIVGHTTDRKKHSVYEGVPGMSMLFELGRIDLCSNTMREQRAIGRLVTELHGLGLEAHDDIVMALWIAICVIRKWQRKRDAKRRKLVGPAPASYVDTFPVREAA